jgi:hypothetical protein
MMRVVVVAILAAILLTQVPGGTCFLARAQERGGQHPRPSPIQRPGNNVMIVRGAGGKGPVANGGIEVPEKPRPLTPSEKISFSSAVIAKLVANRPWTLTPASPIFPNRGWLYFLNPLIVSADFTPAAAFNSQSDFIAEISNPLSERKDRALSVIIKSPIAGKHYLIDCTVNGGETYYVRVLPGGAKQTFNGTNHIVVLYEAASNTDVDIAITAKTSFRWFFYSAEITPFD